MIYWTQLTHINTPPPTPTHPPPQTVFKEGFRFCNYTGKFFCRRCHRNDAAALPARILLNWDFKKVYVSRFAMQAGLVLSFSILLHLRVPRTHIHMF